MPSFIEIRDLSFSYLLNDQKKIPALKHINLDIGKGEFVAIIGRNGSGKSTLGKMLNALLLPNDGRVLISGMNTKDAINHAEIRTQVGMVFQRPRDQIVAATVAEDVAFGPGNLGIPPREIRKRVNEALATAGLAGYDERPSHLLSAGETQRLALAGVLAMRSECLIFDETTAMLDPMGRMMVMQQAGELNRLGKTILLITHRMDEAAQADRVLVMNEGRMAMDGESGEIFSHPSDLREIGLDIPEAASLANDLRKVIHEIPKEILSDHDLFSAIPPFLGEDADLPGGKDGSSTGGRIVQVEGLSHTYLRGTPLAHQSLFDVNFSAFDGQVQVLVGSTGSGKSTLLQHLNAIIRPQNGRVRVLGQDLRSDNLDEKELRSRVGLVFQRPEEQIFEQYVGDEIAFAARNFGHAGRLADVVKTAMHAVGMDFEAFKDRFTSTLSGGEQRKVALASVLAGQPEMLVLDEPLAGLDPSSRVEIRKYLKTLNRGGTSMVISTHQFEDVITLFNGVSALSSGSDALSGTPEEVFGQSELLEKIGLIPPLAVRTADIFREKGWPIPKSIVTSDGLVQAAELSRRGFQA